MGRSFRQLQPQEVIALAIGVETRNAERFDTFAHLFADYDDEVSRLFVEMRDEEIEHKRTLEALYRDRYGDRPCELDEQDIDEVVEAVDIEDAEHLIFDDMTRRRVLQAALRAEQGARQFYAGLLDVTRDEELCRLYRQLSDFEQDHIVALQRRLEELEKEKGGQENDGSA